MRKFILTLATMSSLALTSCSNDEVLDAADDNEIRFSAVTNTVSRSNTHYPGNGYQVDKVAVWASSTNKPSITYMGNACATFKFVEKNEPGDKDEWIFSGSKHYWPESGNPLDFYVVSTGTRNSWIDVSGAKFATSETTGVTKNNLSVAYTLPTDADDQDDLLYAVSENIEKTTYNGRVPLNFRHALACFKFKFAVTNEHFALYVKSVSICNVANSGTLTFGDETTYNNTSSDPKYCSWDVPKIDDNNDNLLKSKMIVSMPDSYEPCYRVYANYDAKTGTGTADTSGKDFELTDKKRTLVINEKTCEQSYCDGYLYAVPQTVTSWNPSSGDSYDAAAGDYSWTGAYFVLECRIYHISDPEGKNYLGPNDETLLYGKKDGTYGKILVPIATNGADMTWEPGKIYTYTFQFGGETANQGYDPENPDQPALSFSEITFGVTDVSTWSTGSDVIVYPNTIGVGETTIDPI